MCLMKSQMGHNVRNRMKAYRVLKNLEASDDGSIIGGSRCEFFYVIVSIWK